MRLRILPLLIVLAWLPWARPAPADDAETRLTEARQKLSSLQEDEERATERYNTARLRVDQLGEQKAEAERRLAAASDAFRDRRESVSRLAVSAYRGGPAAAASLLSADTPAQLAARSSYLDHLAARRQSEVERLRVARSDVEEEGRQLDRLRRDAVAALDTVSSEKAEIERTIDAQQALVTQYAAEVEQIRRERAAAEEAARRRAEAAAAEEAARQEAAARSRSASPSAAPADVGTAPSASSNVPAPSSAASVAVDWARQELGKPYVYGGSGPDSFDCSGLTMYVWGKAGVSLSHAADAQFGEGPHVPRNQLAPGDLVFFGADLYHVGIYVGGNTMIHAPHTGEVVRYEDIDYSGDYYGAVRVG